MGHILNIDLPGIALGLNGIEESKKNQDKLPDRRLDHMVKRWYHLLRWGRLKQEPIEEERIKPSMRALSSLRCPYRWSC